jgi:hypothetical protein
MLLPLLQLLLLLLCRLGCYQKRCCAVGFRLSRVVSETGSCSRLNADGDLLLFCAAAASTCCSPYNLREAMITYDNSILIDVMRVPSLM